LSRGNVSKIGLAEVETELSGEKPGRGHQITPSFRQGEELGRSRIQAAKGCGGYIWALRSRGVGFSKDKKKSDRKSPRDSCEEGERRGRRVADDALRIENRTPNRKRETTIALLHRFRKNKFCRAVHKVGLLADRRGRRKEENSGSGGGGGRENE